MTDRPTPDYDKEGTVRPWFNCNFEVTPMATRKGRVKSTRKPATRGKKPRIAEYTSDAWERISVLAMNLEVVAADLGLHERERDPDGFDVADAARELARLSANYNRVENPEGRNLEAEQSDWVSVGGIGADLGNMADEETRADVAERVRAIAHELCYRACDYLF